MAGTAKQKRVMAKAKKIYAGKSRKSASAWAASIKQAWREEGSSTSTTPKKKKKAGGKRKGTKKAAAKKGKNPKVPKGMKAGAVRKIGGTHYQKRKIGGKFRLAKVTAAAATKIRAKKKKAGGKKKK